MSARRKKPSDRKGPGSRRRSVPAVSLERALSKLGVAPRPESRALVMAGRVQVGGQVVLDPSRRVDPDHDVLRVDGRVIRRAAPEHWLLHKPLGCLTTRRDPEGRPTVYSLLPAGLPFVGPVGRLDRDTSGLLLFTNDTRLAAFLTAPESHVEKVYEVQLDAPIDATEAARVERGVLVLGRRTLPARVELRPPLPSRSMRVTIVEGRNRQVRRMFAALGREVVRLHRVRIGPLGIDGLTVGQARRLRPSEVAALDALRRAGRTGRPQSLGAGRGAGGRGART